ncbi:MAG: DVUA0089 family protein, partial [Deltaproteobacteria bacterium]|nr:DVUA0089 family protein [Deltaproteobacteria bacterium]
TGGRIDTYLALYDMDGNTVITVNDDLSESGFLSRIDWTCDVSGTYYVMVRHSEFRPETGEYTVKITGYGNLSIIIRTMQGLSKLIPPSSLTLYGDVNHDQRIGLEEVIFMLQKISGLR